MSFFKNMKLRRKSSSHFGSNLSLQSTTSNNENMANIPYTVNEKELKPIFKAIWKNDIDKMKKLMKKNYCQLDKDKRTPLHFACALGHSEIMKELISNYRNEILENEDKNKKTSLYKAVERGKLDDVKYLIEKGAKTNIRDDIGESLVHAAVINKHEEVLEYLIEKEVDFVSQNNKGDCPIHVAAQLNYKHGIQILCDNSVDVNVQNDHGRTPLIVAAQCGNLDVVDELLRRNADQSIVDKDGKNAYDHAEFYQYSDICKRLKQIERMNSDGSSSVQIPKSLEEKCFDDADYNHIQSVSKVQLESQVQKNSSQVSLNSNGGNSWMGEYSSATSEETIPKSNAQSIRLQDISTPSSMPNPSDIAVNPRKSVQMRQASDDEESQWSDTETSARKLSVTKIDSDEKIVTVEHKNNDSDWDSDVTENDQHDLLDNGLSVIDEESVKNLNEKSNIPVIHDGHETDSNIEDCYKSNLYYNTNPPESYDSNENLDNSFDDDDQNEFNDMYQTQIINPEYSFRKDNSTPTSKPPISPHSNSKINVPSIYVEEYKSKISKTANAAGDDLSYTSTDIGSRHESQDDSDSMIGSKNVNHKEREDYIKKCARLESRLRVTESEKEELAQSINKITKLKEAAEEEKFRYLSDCQKMEASVSQKMDELADLKARFVSAEEQLKKREQELFEIKKAKQDIEDQFVELERKSIFSNSKIKQLQEENDRLREDLGNFRNNETDVESYRSQLDDERTKWIKENKELKDQLDVIEEKFQQTEADYLYSIDEKKSEIDNLQKDIMNLHKNLNNEIEDKKLLMEEINQFKETIKSLNYDLESSNKSVFHASKLEKENRELQGDAENQKIKFHDKCLENDKLKTELNNSEREVKRLNLEINKLNDLLKSNEMDYNERDLKCKSLERQIEDLQKLLESRNGEIRDSSQNVFVLENQLADLRKKNDSVIEVVNSVINKSLDGSHDLPELQDQLLKLRKFSQNSNAIEISSLSKDLVDNSTELQKSKSQIKALEEQLEYFHKRAEFQAAPNGISKYKRVAIEGTENYNEMERDRIDKLENMEKHNLATMDYQAKVLSQRNGELEDKKFQNEVLSLRSENNRLTEENDKLSDMLMKERKMKDSLTEQLILSMRNQFGSSQQIFGSGEMSFVNGPFPAASQWNISPNMSFPEQRFNSSSLLNLSVIKPMGIDDEELRKKFRIELDRSIAKHLASGKPIDQLNIKEKIRNLNSFRYSNGSLPWTTS